MFNNQAAGIPCPRCSENESVSPEKKKIRTSLLQFVAMRAATCENCGLVLKLVLDDKGKQALQMAATLKNTLDESQRHLRGH